MANYSTNEFKSGLKVILEGDPCNIIENEFVKPGKGQAFNRVKLKNLRSGRVWERTFKSGETLESADVMEFEMEYLYNDGTYWHFMKTDEVFEQVASDKAALDGSEIWLNETDRATVIFFLNDNPILVTPSNFVELAVVETDPGVKGRHCEWWFKPATLKTGAVIKVPLFVNIGEVVRVDTRTGEYQGRVKAIVAVFRRGILLDLLFRSETLKAIRKYFYSASVIEVVTPVIQKFASSEVFIESIEVKNYGYLHTSPEHAMKQLLSKYKDSIFQICPVFRANEVGSFHKEEFQMLEWYRSSFDLTRLAEDTEKLLNFVLKEIGANFDCTHLGFPFEKVSYKTLFFDVFSENPHTISLNKLSQISESLNIPN